MTTETFRFSPDVFIRLGEELIPNPEQGILELVKNSYDADARSCTVKLSNTAEEGGTITVTDNGVGMGLDEIANGWLVIGRSSKSSTRQPVGKFGRLPVGDKGIGRLLALRLGKRVRLTTRPESQSGTEHSLVIEWERFETANLVEEIPFNIGTGNSSEPTGTTITIDGLRIKLGKREIQRLARELLLLADPFDERFSFRPRLVAPEFRELEKLVKDAYFEDADYSLIAELGDDGIAQARLMDWKGEFIAQTQIPSKRPFLAPRARFELWSFKLSGKSFVSKQSSLTEVRQWLSVVGGVHLYHRGLRVRPFGDHGYDWLGMDLARVQSPEERPSTNNSIGRVIVDDPEDQLVQKTDRIGFIETESFAEIRRFAIESLEWMADIRERMAEERRKQERERAERDLKNANQSLTNVVETVVPAKNREIVRATIEKYKRAVDRNIRSLRDDLQLYRSLATAGITAAVFAHEAGKPVTLLKKTTQRIELVGKRHLGDAYESALSRPVNMLVRIARALESYATFPIFLLKREKRRSGQVAVHSVIDNICGLFNPFFTDANIEVVTEKVEQDLFVYGSESLLESIITNLLMNTINAFNVEGARNNNRKVIIRTQISGNRTLLKVLDNGCGISSEIGLDEIWLPGKSTTPGGTGFGLTIVRDCASDLGGSAHAAAQGELGGAEFTITLPLSSE